jgi:adenosylcobinamide-GDP ribazoletransferase
MGLATLLGSVRAAVGFLTRLPIGARPPGAEELRWSTASFPLVGALLGLLQALVFLAVQRAGPLPAAGCAVAVGLLLTGAFHEDGLADTADALGGAFDREKLFAILKDSRIGSYGGAALASVLLLRVSLVAALGSAAPLGLLVSQSLGRLPPVWLLGALPYVTSDQAARSKPVVQAGPGQLLVASLQGLLLLAALFALGRLGAAEAAALLGAGGLVALVCGRRFQLRAGGLTGDFLGATEQVGECALLLVLAISRGAGR